MDIGYRRKRDCAIYVVITKALTDQLRCYSTADLRLCFGILKNRFSNVGAQIISTAHRRAYSICRRPASSIGPEHFQTTSLCITI